MGGTISRRRFARRFTLVELMTVVAVIGVLAAIAIPLVYNNQLKAKRAEIVLNLDGLLDAATAYAATFDTYGTGSVDFQPGPYFDKTAHPWDDASIPQVFIDLGWMPDGDVRASYFYDTDDVTYVWVVAQADMDDDGNNYYLRDAIDPVTGDRTTPDLEICLGGGSVLDCF
jgi:prepilin-type N-terminal cleavage/methylation domain-containing protein